MGVIYIMSHLDKGKKKRKQEKAYENVEYNTVTMLL